MPNIKPIKTCIYFFIILLFLSCGNSPKADKEITEIKQKPEVKWQDVKRAGTANGGRFFEDNTGKKMFNGETFHNTHEFFRNYCVVSKMVDGKELHGVINLKGEVMIGFKYDYMEDCYNPGYFKITSKEPFACGMIDSAGKIAIPMTYHNFGFINNGILKAQSKDQKWGLITIKNETITPFTYDFIGAWNSDLARVSKDKNYKSNYGYIDRSGKEVITCQYPVACDFEQGIALVKKGDKIGFINAKNETVIDFQFDNYKEVVDVTKDQMSTSGYKESNKRFIMEEGYIVLSKNKKWGYLDVKGNEVISFEYDNIWLPNSTGVVNIEKNGKRGSFDIKSKKITWS